MYRGKKKSPNSMFRPVNRIEGRVVKLPEKGETRSVREIPQAPVLNTANRISKKVNSVQAELTKATCGGQAAEEIGLALAREKILNSPRTNLQFRKTVARKVDYKPDEQVFSHLASLSIHEDNEKGLAKRQLGRPSQNQDPEPRLDDFHRPYEGEETSAVADLFTIRNLIDLSNTGDEAPVQPRRVLQRALMPNFFKR